MNKMDFQSPTGGKALASKKPRLGSAANDNPNENAAYSAPSSPSAVQSNVENAYNDDEKATTSEEVEGDAEKQSESWDEIVLQMRQSSADTTDLENYLKGSTQRREALKRLELEFNQFQKGLENNLENYALQEVVQKYEQICASNDKQEAKIRKYFIQNHAKRTKLYAILQKCDHGWKQCSETLFHQINGQHASENDPTLLPPEEEDEGAHIGDMLEETPEQEPNWELLKEYEPSRVDIECFLAGRHRLQLAQERFCQAYEEVQQNLLSINEEVTKILVTSIDSLDVPIDQMENQLQCMLADNFLRRQNMEKKIQEAAQKQQGLFQTLMCRVSMKN